jgi:hypothetical protein
MSKFMKRLFFVIIFSGLVFNVFPQNSQIPVLNIKAYLNNIEIEGPVYKNIYSPPVQGIEYLNSYVRLTSIFKLLESEIEFFDGILSIHGTDIVRKNNEIKIQGERTGDIIILVDQNYITSSLLNEKIMNQKNKAVISINGEYFIQISMVRYLINGALQEDKNSVTLFTRDYERQDIPSTLNDCYVALNKILNEQTKIDIKISSIEELVKYHMNLGMWIRNNWIRQTNNRITKFLSDNGVRNVPDDMSQTIIIGYHYYLNGIEKTVKEIYNE